MCLFFIVEEGFLMWSVFIAWFFLRDVEPTSWPPRDFGCRLTVVNENFINGLTSLGSRCLSVGSSVARIHSAPRFLATANGLAWDVTS